MKREKAINERRKLKVSMILSGADHPVVVKKVL